ncbi:MAG: hypothetical protein RLZZ522_15 [Verrucomicrobiota bacterium]
MRVHPLPQGGLAIQLESTEEWPILSGILRDARMPGFNAAGQVGCKMTGATDRQDWAEFVLPDLREGFEHHLKTVLKAIETARFEAAGGPGAVVISGAESFDWYASLNQARLALEARYQFSAGLPGDSRAPEQQAALYRTQFYCAIQSLLLDLGLE